MNPQLILQLLSMLATAEPVVLQAVHDFLAGTGGQTDQAVLTADAIDWKDIQKKAQAAIDAKQA